VPAFKSYCVDEASHVPSPSPYNPSFPSRLPSFLSHTPHFPRLSSQALFEPAESRAGLGQAGYDFVIRDPLILA